MRVLGINKSATLNGKELRYGGSAIVNDGRLLAALLEERASRKKWAGGYGKSLDALLKTAGSMSGHKRALTLRDFDCIAVSTCCESEVAAGRGHSFEGNQDLITVDHHLSHAALAYFTSPFDPALIAVIDGGGNTLSDDLAPQHWWSHRRQQHSYYLGHGDEIRLLERDFDEPFATGFGELYRAFTYFLGFQSSRFASKVMALSGYGIAENITKKPIVQLDGGKFIIPVKNNPRDPLGMVSELSNALDISFGDPRKPGTEVLNVHTDIAAYLQRSLQAGLELKFRYLTAKYNVNDICLGGGFALNCVANGILAQMEGLRAYAPCAPGDEGQAIGNAIFASVRQKQNGFRTLGKSSSQVQLGPEHHINSGRVVSALREHSISDALVFEPLDLAQTVGNLLNIASAVAVCHGRSEAGLRALGNRSILGDPRKDRVKVIFNNLKGREWFQPFAPAIRDEFAAQFFNTVPSSPFMSFAVPVRSDRRTSVPSVTHVDGTARVQTLNDGTTSLLGNILTHFHALTDVPIVLNTSFNCGGEPIVETPEDAVETFARVPVNALVVERFLVIKSFFPALSEMGLLPTRTLENVSVTGRSASPGYRGPDAIRSLLRWIQQTTGQVFFIRSTFPLYGEYLDWLYEGKKVTTIRFRKGAVEYPGSYTLSLFATKDYTLAKAPGRTTHVEVQGIKYCRFGDLDEADARRDGFQDHPDMVRALTAIYPTLRSDDWVTVYRIAPTTTN